MDHRVRDLDQIQERDQDDRGRRIGTILLATTAVVGLTFAIGVVVGRAAEPAPQSDDPLARLDGNAASRSAPGKALEIEPAEPKVERSELSFPNTLSEQEERPEVIAALQAAAAEEAALAQPEPAAAALDPITADSITVVKLAAAQPAAPATDDEPVEAEQIVANIPAAVAAGAGARSLPKAAKHDALVAAAMRSDEPKSSAPRGYEGAFTLQVISYDSPGPSHAFAEGLRAKGHMAFVTAADIPERGRFHRVRIGPFKTRPEADAYRQKFEDEEHMNTFVVRVKQD